LPRPADEHLVVTLHDVPAAQKGRIVPA